MTQATHYDDREATRYTYGGPYRTIERAETALEDMYANGEVCDGERPRIERRSGKIASWAPAKTRYYITLA